VLRSAGSGCASSNRPFPIAAACPARLDHTARSRMRQLLAETGSAFPHGPSAVTRELLPARIHSLQYAVASPGFENTQSCRPASSPSGATTPGGGLGLEFVPVPLQYRQTTARARVFKTMPRRLALHLGRATKIPVNATGSACAQLLKLRPIGSAGTRPKFPRRLCPRGGARSGQGERVVHCMMMLLYDLVGYHQRLWPECSQAGPAMFGV